MRIKIEDKEECKLQMAPMIDMVFLLVIFFMCASHLSSQQSLQLEIPTASHGVIPKERPDRWVVNIMKDGSLYGGKDPFTLDRLKQLVSAQVKANPSLKIYLRADTQTPHKEVKKVMNAMAEVGVDDFIFGVYSPGEE